MARVQLNGEEYARQARAVNEEAKAKVQDDMANGQAKKDGAQKKKEAEKDKKSPAAQKADQDISEADSVINRALQTIQEANEALEQTLDNVRGAHEKEIKAAEANKKAAWEAAATKRKKVVQAYSQTHASPLVGNRSPSGRASGAANAGPGPSSQPEGKTPSEVTMTPRSEGIGYI